MGGQGPPIAEIAEIARHRRDRKGNIFTTEIRSKLEFIPRINADDRESEKR